MNKESIPIIAPLFRFQWEEAQKCYVVLYPEGMVKLSPSAGEIMKLVNAEDNISKIIKTLSDQFDGADVGEDVVAFFIEAESNGWIQLK